jgi:hypothetical protein
VDTWHGTFPTEDSATAWAAVDALAHRYVLDGTCSVIDQARGKALTDLVTGNADITVNVVLTVPADTGSGGEGSSGPDAPQGNGDGGGERGEAPTADTPGAADEPGDAASRADGDYDVDRSSGPASETSEAADEPSRNPAPSADHDAGGAGKRSRDARDDPAAPARPRAPGSVKTSSR